MLPENEPLQKDNRREMEALPNSIPYNPDFPPMLPRRSGPFPVCVRQVQTGLQYRRGVGAPSTRLSVALFSLPPFHYVFAEGGGWWHLHIQLKKLSHERGDGEVE